MSATPSWNLRRAPRAQPTAGSPSGGLLGSNRLRWYHWAVVGLSALLTFAVARVIERQIEARERTRFEVAAEHDVEHIVVRLGRYEDALWGGVGAIKARNELVDAVAWRAFADALDLGARFPGMNGIGVIHHVPAAGLDGYLARQRLDRPTFDVHPERVDTEYLPITFIEPEAPNAEAIGLDVAHEANRLEGARRARDSGLSTVTGPIVLVQDARRTAGFLFYAPFYVGSLPASAGEAERRGRFVGMVYAPVIVSELIESALDGHGRPVGLSVTDDGVTIYDEHVHSEPGLDASPAHRTVLERELYGRTWMFDVRSTLAFRESSSTYQPAAVLLAGLSLDALLLGLFLTMSRANRRAVELADELTVDLREKTSRLERSNGDLELFASVASHDLREPLRMVGGFTRLLQKRYEGKLDADADRYIGFAIGGVARMQALLENMLSYARVDAEPGNLDRVDLNEVCRDAIEGLGVLLEENGVQVEIGPLPTLRVDPTQLMQVFQNLVANAAKFRAPGRLPRVEISAQELDSEWVVRVADNGVGIERRYLERVFVMFQQVDVRDGTHEGSGIGLAVCRKIVHRHGGKIEIESEPGVGSTVRFTLDKNLPAGIARAPAAA